MMVRPLNYFITLSWSEVLVFRKLIFCSEKLNVLDLQGFSSLNPPNLTIDIRFQAPHQSNKHGNENLICV